jgi:toxin HigB-1
MIKSFMDGLTESIRQRKRIKGFPSNLFKIARRKLGLLEDAVELNDLRIPPGDHLEALKGFRWVDGNAFDVEITNYH